MSTYRFRSCYAVLSVRVAGGLGGWTPLATFLTPQAQDFFDPPGGVGRTPLAPKSDLD